MSSKREESLAEIKGLLAGMTEEECGWVIKYLILHKTFGAAFDDAIRKAASPEKELPPRDVFLSLLDEWWGNMEAATLHSQDKE